MSITKILFVGLCLALSVSGRDRHFRTNTGNLTFSVEPNDDSIYHLLGSSQVDNLTAGIFPHIPDMKTLYVVDDSIREIQPGAFQNIPQLKYLTIQYNDISKIEAGIFNNFPNLTYLQLSDNKISYIDPHAFDNLARLTTLRLVNNKLTQIDSHWFENKPDLNYINFAGNLLKKISADAFVSLKGRKSMFLTLGRNPVEVIEDDAFRGFKDFSLLSLGNLNLTMISGTFLQGLKIKKLKLNRNKFICVEEKDFDKVFVAETTEMRENPLEPECLKKIQVWTQKHNKKILTVWGFNNK
nr:PREDICTED: leucine-rich repeats and immunoglobulin-like domains protein 2 [Tribolium castaneum]|eukprot:XP_008200852.1 PREDICTED: leucine-rich repeats and immunoglobulin-like domains protein 2 [Tribolium castaneum]